ncbi:hypothetical protein DPM13_02290 [Paracoccus mutanolyticus]|uniref:HTH-like domain-containing protein n=1 Tax=Paracoccus mutanolyticus TaxID=1499308 RepID=A0ABM6WPG8_9RHOB|nr:hypothetical protein DPM13_02290 [Paracoccus mutanolyticus]
MPTKRASDVWHQLRREGRDIARCTVERLMKVMGLQGVVRGKKVVTTNLDAAQPCPDDKVKRWRAWARSRPRTRKRRWTRSSPRSGAWRPRETCS